MTEVAWTTWPRAQLLAAQRLPTAYGRHLAYRQLAAMLIAVTDAVPPRARSYWLRCISRAHRLAERYTPEEP